VSKVTKTNLLCKKEEFTLKQLQNLGNRFKQLRKAKGYTNYEYLLLTTKHPNMVAMKMEKIYVFFKLTKSIIKSS